MREERARLPDAAQVHRRQHEHQEPTATVASWPRARTAIADAAFWTPDEIDTATVST